MVVDGEHPIGIAGKGNKAEAVPTAQVINSQFAGRASKVHLIPYMTFTTASGVASPPE